MELMSDHSLIPGLVESWMIGPTEMNRKRMKYIQKGILQVYVHIQYTAQKNMLVSLQKKSPFLAKFYFFPQKRAIKSIFFPL